MPEKTRTNARSRTDDALEHAEDAVRASIEAAAKIARDSMETGTDTARKVQTSLRDALEALRGDGRSTGSSSKSTN